MSKLRGPRTLRAAISVLASLMLVLAMAGGVAAGTSIHDVTPSSNTVGQGLISPTYTVQVHNTSSNNSHYYKVSAVSGAHGSWPTATNGLTVASSDCVAIGANVTQPVHVTVATSAPATFIGLSTLTFTARQFSDSSCTTASDGDYVKDTVTATLVVVAPIATTTTLAVAPASPSAYGQSVTFTATVTAGATGTVTFKDGTTTLGAGTLSASTATFSTSGLSVGNHSISAVYGGDTTHSTSTSAALAQQVTAFGARDHLAFGVQPSAVLVGTTINPSVTVLVQDTYGNTVTSSTASISLGLGGGTGNLSSTAPVNAVNGVATFSGLSVDRAGTFHLHASTTGLSTAESDNFIISRVPLTLTITKYICTTYRQVPANANATNADATGGHGGEAGLDTPNCKTADGWRFGLYAGQNETTPIETTAPTSGGSATVTLNAQEIDLARNGTGALWVREVTQDGVAGFGAIRCDGDAINGDNLEQIRNVPPIVHAIACTAYNVQQTITFTAGPTGVTVGASGFSVSASATSTLAVTYSSTTPSICSVTAGNGALTLLAAGTCTIAANQGGQANPFWAPAPQVTHDVAIGKAGQTLSFTSAVPVGATVGGSYTAVAVSDKGVVPVTLTIDAASTSGACSINGSGLVSFTGAGHCIVDANQVGNGTYNAALQVQQSFDIGPATPVISFTSNPGSPVVGGPAYTVTATSPSPATITFSLDVTSTGCSLAGDVVTYTGVGTCKIDANQLATTNWTAAAQAQQSFAVGKAGQTLSWTSTAPVGASVGGSYTAAATSSAGLTHSLGYVSNSTVFTTGSGASCTNAVCTSNTAATYTVTGTYDGKVDTATLIVTAGDLHHIAISPNPQTIVAGATQAYLAKGFDANGNSLGDVTGSTTFTIDGTGSSCAVEKCGSTIVGDYTVTGTYLGELTDTAILHVTAVPPIATPTPTPIATPTPIEQVGGVVATPVRAVTLPPTSSNGSSSSNDSLPMLLILIALAFGGIGLLAAHAQRRTIRL